MPSYRTLIAVAACTLATLCAAGPLNPPGGAVAATAKPLVDIEPRTAINAENTPGDGNSIFVISQPGSYYLTANLAAPNGKNGIKVLSANVSIDLNGFTLAGDTTSLLGVNADTYVGVTVRNGTVRNFQGGAVKVGATGRIEKVTSRYIGNTAFYAGTSSTLTDCTADLCWGGYVTAHGSILTGCIASFCQTGGFVGNSTAFKGCTAYQNGGTGFTAFDASSLDACTSTRNNGEGAGLGIGAVLVTNCVFHQNSMHGLTVSDNTVVLNCNCVGNGLGSGAWAGIRVAGSDCRIEGNTCTGNRKGIVVTGTGNLIFRNACATNAVGNWDIAANNVYGQIVDRVAPASPAVTTNAAASTTATTDPLANFSY